MPHIQEKLKAILSPTNENKTYERLSDDMKENLGAVLEFFLNEELVHKYILKFANDYEQFDSQKSKKTLRCFFTQWGAENGFNQGDTRENKKAPLRYKYSDEIYKLSKFELPKEIPYLVGILPSSLFTHVFLRFGYLICDPGAGTGHGKWTHSLQLFMLEEALKNKDLKLMNCDSIVNLMKEISSYEYRGNGIFGPLFDSQTRTDYTRPELLMKAILNENLIQSDSMTKLRKKLLEHKNNIAQLEGKNEEEKTTKYEKKFIKNATHYYGFQKEAKSVGFFWGKSNSNNDKLIEPVIEEQTNFERYKSLANKFFPN